MPGTETPSTPAIGAAQLGVVSYNGVDFGATRYAKLTGKPVYDQADRTVTHIQYMLVVHAFITAKSVTLENGKMDTLQDKLLQQGRNLVINNIGFDAGINTGNRQATPDLIFGAKPRLMEFENVGAGLGWEVVWHCEFNVSRCNSKIFTTPKSSLVAFNYDVVYSINHEGLLTRVTSGYLQIPIGRSEAEAERRRLFQNIESTWSGFTVTVPYGFRRAETTRRLNEAKNRIDFSIIDVELTGDAFPNGIVEAQGDYEFENVGVGFVKWVATLNMSLTVAPRYHPALAGQKFFVILFDRVRRLMQTVTQEGKTGFLLPTRLRMGHRLWSRTSRFSFSFTVHSHLFEILTGSGLWTPLPESNWRAWAKSMGDVWGNRGVSGLLFNKSDEAIIDICSGTTALNIGNDGSSARSTGKEDVQLLRWPKPTEEASYIAYHNEIRTVVEEDAVLHSFSQEYDPDESESKKPKSRSSVTPQVVQYAGTPSVKILMSGYASRVGFKPVAPKLLSYGGAPVVKLAETIKIDDTPSASFLGYPMYKGKWTILYQVIGPSGSDLKFDGKRPSPTITDKKLKALD